MELVKFLVEYNPSDCLRWKCFSCQICFKDGKRPAFNIKNIGKISLPLLLSWGFFTKDDTKGGIFNFGCSVKYVIIIREYAGKEELKLAFKKAMVNNHPDRGGSPFIAAKITEAKNIMDS